MPGARGGPRAPAWGSPGRSAAHFRPPRGPFRAHAAAARPLPPSARAPRCLACVRAASRLPAAAPRARRGPSRSPSRPRARARRSPHGSGPGARARPFPPPGFWAGPPPPAAAPGAARRRRPPPGRARALRRRCRPLPRLPTKHGRAAHPDAGPGRTARGGRPAPPLLPPSRGALSGGSLSTSCSPPAPGHGAPEPQMPEVTHVGQNGRTPSSRTLRPGGGMGPVPGTQMSVGAVARTLSAPCGRRYRSLRQIRSYKDSLHLNAETGGQAAERFCWQRRVCPVWSLSF